MLLDTEFNLIEPYKSSLAAASAASTTFVASWLRVYYRSVLYTIFGVHGFKYVKPVPESPRFRLKRANLHVVPNLHVVEQHSITRFLKMHGKIIT